MQLGSDQEQQGFVALDLLHFKRRGKAGFGHFVPVAAKAGGACGPADELQIAQPAGRFLAVGLQRVGRVLVLVMALSHLERLGDEKCARVHLLVVTLLKIGKYRGVAAQQARFEQRGLHRHIGGRFAQAVADGTHAGADLQARVPATADEGLDGGTPAHAQIAAALIGKQHQHVHVGMRKQLPAPIATHGHQRGLWRQPGALPEVGEQMIGLQRQLVQQRAHAACGG
ncbi:hypothetical protein SDC9_141053 [bioreactor metagenome]|uniref:Uncharacterized protein n=1 Tax=bioreactor metagenome TaxID=1076179 RepID=A0A645DX66_9ZZZZ